MRRLKIIGAVLGVVVMSIAFVGAADSPEAMGATGVDKKVKKLNRQVAQLRKQVNRLQRALADVPKQPGPQGPQGTQGTQGAQGPPGPATGPAGGDLRGNYPNPLIGLGAVGSSEIANGAVERSKIARSAVSANEIEGFAINARHLNGNSVGGTVLKDVTAVVGPGVTVNAGVPQRAEVTCPSNARLIGAGYAWQDDEPNSIIYSAPSEINPRGTWKVRGMVDAGSNTLFAWANCLAP